MEDFIYILCGCSMFITRRVHGRFYGFDLKGNSCHGEEIDSILEDQRNLDLNMTCVVNSY